MCIQKTIIFSWPYPITVSSCDTCAIITTNISRHTFTSLFTLCWTCIMRFLDWSYWASRTFDFSAGASTSVPKFVRATLKWMCAQSLEDTSTCIGVTVISRRTFTSDVDFWRAISLNCTCYSGTTTFSLGTCITSESIVFTKWTLSRYSPGNQ